MDLSKLGLFHSMKERMHWLAQRQRILAQNVSNSDTPNYVARDLKELDFQKVVRQLRTTTNLHMAETRSGHMGGSLSHRGEHKAQPPKVDYEVVPTGNAVNLEEQMLMLSKNSGDYQETTNLYRKYNKLFKMAVGGQ